MLKTRQRKQTYFQLHQVMGRDSDGHFGPDQIGVCLAWQPEDPADSEQLLRLTCGCVRDIETSSLRNAFSDGELIGYWLEVVA